MKYSSLLYLISFLFFSCSNGVAIDALKGKIDSLEYELDKEKNGAAKLYAKIKINAANNDYISVENNFAELSKRHPGSIEYQQAKSIRDSVVLIKSKNEKIAEERRTKEINERKLALTKLKKTHDDVSGITWYHQRYFTHYVNSNHISLSLGNSEGTQPWLRLTMSYNGEDWIFFENVYLSHDGQTKQIFFDDYKEKKTDNGDGGVWEWVEVGVEDNMISFLKSFATSTNAKIRFSGKYSETRLLTKNERQGILDIINGYEYLKSI